MLHIAPLKQPLNISCLIFSPAAHSNSVFLSVTVRHKKDQIHALSPPTPVLLSWYVSWSNLKRVTFFKTSEE